MTDRRRIELAPRETSAKHPIEIVRRVRAMHLMGLKLRRIAEVCQLSPFTVQDYTLRRKRLGEPSKEDILQAAWMVARWVAQHGGGAR